MWQRVGGSIDHEIDRYRPQQAVEGVGFCQAVADGPDNNPVAIAEDVYLQIFSGAKRSLTITTPYLAIDEAMLKTLSIAGDAGVEVRLLLPGVPDHKVAYLVAQSYFKQLLEHHVQIYLYTPGLLHGKTVLADDEAAFIGSVNMDYRSFQLHFECGVVLYDMPTLADLRQDMENMIAQSHLLTAGEWNRRSWIRKIAGKALRLFAMWM